MSVEECYEFIMSKYNRTNPWTTILQTGQNIKIILWDIANIFNDRNNDRNEYQNSQIRNIANEIKLNFHIFIKNTLLRGQRIKYEFIDNNYIVINTEPGIELDDILICTYFATLLCAKRNVFIVSNDDYSKLNSPMYNHQRSLSELVNDCGANFQMLLDEYAKRQRVYRGENKIEHLGSFYSRPNSDNTIYFKKYIKYKKKYLNLKNNL